MRWLPKLRSLFGALGVVAAITVAPVIFFAYKFHDNDFSENISDWGSFGDYVGGILNPIISLASLIFIGIITVLVSRLSNEEGYLNQIKLKRLDAIEQIHNNMFKVISFNSFLTRIMIMMNEFNGASINPVNIERAFGHDFDTLQHYSKEIGDTTIFFINLPIAYGPLFNYDFKSQEYQETKTLIKKLDDGCWNITLITKKMVAQNNFLDSELQDQLGGLIQDYLKIYDELISKFSSIVNSLKKEI